MLNKETLKKCIPMAIIPVCIVVLSQEIILNCFKLRGSVYL